MEESTVVPASKDDEELIPISWVQHKMPDPPLIPEITIKVGGGGEM